MYISYIFLSRDIEFSQKISDSKRKTCFEILGLLVNSYIIYDPISKTSFFGDLKQWQHY